MSDVNYCVLCGRLTRDAELKYTPSGFAICNLAVAVNRREKKGEEWGEVASFFDAVIIGKRAEGLAQYLTKGKQVVVAGELRQSRWQDKASGANRSKVEISINEIQLIGGGGKDREQGTSRPAAKADAFNDDNVPF